MRFVPGGAAVIVAAAMAASALSACSGDAVAIVTETPTPTSVSSPAPTPSPISSVSPSPSAGPLTDEELLALMPDGADIPDFYGASVTAVFFLEQYGPMFQTGDTRIWEALSAEGCEYCVNAADEARNLDDDGWKISGGELAVEPSGPTGTLTEEGAALVLSATISESTWRAPGDEKVSTEPGALYEYGLLLSHTGKLWEVVEVALERDTP